MVRVDPRLSRRGQVLPRRRREGRTARDASTTCPRRVADRYYLDNAERTDLFKVKIVTSDDEMVSDVIIEGDDEEVDSLPPHP